MEVISNKIFEGERALFTQNNLLIDSCTFQNGESPLKEGRNLIISNSTFSWKYPLWYCTNVKVNNSLFNQMARAGIWYTNDIRVSNTKFISPKMFRRCKGVIITNVTFEDGKETLWNCDDVKLTNVQSIGDYFGMNSSNIEINNFKLDGNYPFDGCKHILIENSILNSRDAFWNCDDVKVINCTIKGEYIGWNSSNIVFENCTIESLQGFCYMKNVVLRNCKLINTTLAFEYSTVDCEVNSTIDSVKNPSSGKIVSYGIKELIMEADRIDPSKTILITKKE